MPSNSGFFAVRKRKSEVEPPDSSSVTLTELQDENRRLKRAVDELTTLNDLAREIGAFSNPRKIIKKIIRLSNRAVNAAQGVITLIDQRDNSELKTLVRAFNTVHDREQFHFDQSLLGWMVRNRQPLLSNTPHDDKRLGGKLDHSIRSLLCVPLLAKSQLIGVLTVFNKKVEPGLKEIDPGFNEADQRLLAIIAIQSAQVIENARLGEENRSFELVQEQLRMAAKIQSDLLPGSSPQIAGYDVAGASESVQEVGGDYFDFIPIDEHRLALCLGDVSGKGLPASLLMANLQATLRGQVLVDAPMGFCIGRANRLLYQSISPEKFVTMFFGILDTREHTLQFCNAGHEYPFLLTADDSEIETIRRLSTGGTMLGFRSIYCYEEEIVSLQEQDTLVIFSDGITDAENAAMEPFGEKRLAALLHESRDLGAAELITQIRSAAQQHANGRSQLDDISVVVVKRES
ncbi:MAG: SpoIIE family protein phosphatase [bacterium]|nr:SpoIIE family protein phosphatase [bacterium]